MGGGSRTSPPFETGETALETSAATRASDRRAATGAARALPAPEAAPLVTLVSAGDGLRAALMSTRHRGRRWDVIVADRVLVLCRVRGIDPVVAGAVIGFVLLPVIGVVPGALVGRRIGRKRGRGGTCEYCRMPVSALRADPRHRTLRVAEIRTAVLAERRAAGA